METTEEEQTVVGVDDALKPTAGKIKPNDMTRDLITSDSTPCATIPACMPRKSTIGINTAVREIITIISYGKRVLEVEQSRSFMRLTQWNVRRKVRRQSR